MKITHHLSDMTLMAYSAGNLTASLSFVSATHLSLCENCRARLEQFEEIGAQKLNTIEASPLSSRALQEVMALIDMEESNHLRNSHPMPKKGTDLPRPLGDFINGDFNALPWKTVAPGIKVYTLNVDGALTAQSHLKLLKIAPGVTIPQHSHTGSELTLVLQGSYSDEIGRFKTGDIADLDDENEHQPIADTHEDCICLIATENPLKFKSVVPKLFQYFTGL